MSGSLIGRLGQALLDLSAHPAGVAVTLGGPGRPSSTWTSRMNPSEESEADEAMKAVLRVAIWTAKILRM